jgi:hypothetical protein
MEFLDGVPLSTIAQRLGPLPIPLACELTRQAALGLQAAHEARMVHRDIKPSNLMLTRHGSGARVVIIDWGLVKWSDAGEPPGLASTEGRELTLLGTTVGTIGYVSPEQLRAEPHLDSRADLFSLGITLGVLLTAKEARQWSSGLPEAVHRAGESPRIAALRHLRRDLPTGLSTIIGKMIDEFSDRRFSHPQAAADALQRWSQGVTAVTLRQILDANSLAPVADIMPRRPAEADSSPFQNASTVSHPSPGATPNAPMPQRPPLVTAPAAVGSLPLAPIATPSPPVFPVVARPPMPPAPPLPDGHVHRPQLSYWSVVAGYLGLVSLACLPLGPLAIAAGVMGLRQIRVASASAGRVRAWVGIITGVAGSLGLLFVPMVYYVAATKPPEVDSKAESTTGIPKTRVEIDKLLAAQLRSRSANNLKQLGVALHVHHDEHDCFPAQAIVGRTGTKLLSWRVKLLPQLGHGELYSLFRLNEPWDSEHNKQLIPKMPPVFASPYMPPQLIAEGLTTYLVPVAENTVFGGVKATSMSYILDGTSKTIAVVEAAPDAAGIWTRPEDLEVAKENPFRYLAGQYDNSFLALFADGEVRTIVDDYPAAKLWLLFTKDDGEPLEFP